MAAGVFTWVNSSADLLLLEHNVMIEQALLRDAAGFFPGTLAHEASQPIQRPVCADFILDFLKQAFLAHLEELGIVVQARCQAHDLLFGLWRTGSPQSSGLHPFRHELIETVHRSGTTTAQWKKSIPIPPSSPTLQEFWWRRRSSECDP